jgi:hypothetical protein
MASLWASWNAPIASYISTSNPLRSASTSPVAASVRHR